MDCSSPVGSTSARTVNQGMSLRVPDDRGSSCARDDRGSSQVPDDGQYKRDNPDYGT